MIALLLSFKFNSVFIFLFFFDRKGILAIELRTSHLPGKCCATELNFLALNSKFTSSVIALLT